MISIVNNHLSILLDLFPFLLSKKFHLINWKLNIDAAGTLKNQFFICSKSFDIAIIFQ